MAVCTTSAWPTTSGRGVAVNCHWVAGGAESQSQQRVVIGRMRWQRQGQRLLGPGQLVAADQGYQGPMLINGKDRRHRRWGVERRPVLIRAATGLRPVAWSAAVLLLWR